MNKGLGLYITRHDQTRRSWGYKARNFVKNLLRKVRGLPETVLLHGGKGTVRLPDIWVKFLDSINTPDAQRYLRKLQGGWLNSGPFPNMQELTFGGNYVNVIAIKGHKAYVETYFTNQTPPPNRGKGTLIQKFSVVYSDNHSVMGTDTPAGNAYIFLIANPGEKLWIDLEDLQKAY